jgi:hypothetical protein
VEAGWVGQRPRPSGEGGRRLGLGEGSGPRDEEGEWASGRPHGPGGKSKEAGPKSLLGLKSKEVKENKFLIDFWIKIRIRN